jgi:hypothetical protein
LIALTACVAARAPQRALEVKRMLARGYDPSAEVLIIDMGSVCSFFHAVHQIEYALLNGLC